jgi:uncharacterized protein YceK
MRTIGIICAVLALSGCASMVDRPLAARVGLPIATVISQIGYPTSERVVAGKRVYTWVRRMAYEGNQMECEASYEVNDAGIVVDYHWQGQIGACNF